MPFSAVINEYLSVYEPRHEIPSDAKLSQSLKVLYHIKSNCIVSNVNNHLSF